jgi:type I restriction enzyme S subunit
MNMHGTGSAIPGLARKDLSVLPLLVPPARVMTEFQAFVEPIDTLIFALAKTNCNLCSTRDLLLRKLISGEISVENLEEEALAEAV